MAYLIFIIMAMHMEFRPILGRMWPAKETTGIGHHIWSILSTSNRIPTRGQ